ncbi:MAG: hypothetical protein WCF99_03040 [Chloroflexales bacterium]
MTTSLAYQTVAQSYVDNVNTLFGRAGHAQPESATRLLTQIDALLVTDQALQKAASALLTHPTEDQREVAATGLLALALTNVNIGELLLSAAEDEQSGVSWPGTRSDRGLIQPDTLDWQLSLILGTSPPTASRTQTDRTLPAEPARLSLQEAVGDAISEITEAASRLTQQGLENLTALASTEIIHTVGPKLAHAAALLSDNIPAQPLIARVGDLLQRAYSALITAIGAPALSEIGKQILIWVDDWRKGATINALVESMYGAPDLRESLEHLISTSKHEAHPLIDIIIQVDRLAPMYGCHIRLGQQLFEHLKYARPVLTQLLPQSMPFLAAFIIAVVGYGVLAGADYLDAPHFQPINRIQGIAGIVKAGLEPINP